MPVRSLLPPAAACLLALSCAASTLPGESLLSRPSRPVTPAPGSAQARAAASALEAGAAAWKDRADPARLQEALAQWSEAARLAPSAEAHVRLAEGRFFQAQAHANTPAAQRSALEQGLAAAEVGLSLASPELVRRLRNDTPWAEALVAVGPEAVPALYWYAATLDALAGLDNPLLGAFKAERVAPAMQRCLHLDPGYGNAGPLRFVAASLAMAPVLGGQDLVLSQIYFKDALRRAPAYQGTRVLMARTWCVKKGDKALFKRLLEEVVAADPTAAPELAADHALARRQAEDLLRRKDQIFPGGWRGLLPW